MQSTITITNMSDIICHTCGRHISVPNDQLEYFLALGFSMNDVECMPCKNFRYRMYLNNVNAIRRLKKAGRWPTSAPRFWGYVK